MLVNYKIKYNLKKIISFILIAWMLLLTIVGTGNVQGQSSYLYVSPTGSDSNLGTQDSPFKTIQKAADVAVAGTTVYIRGGVYNQPINLLYGNGGGNSSSPVTYKNYANEEVIIEGSNISISYGGGLFHIWSTNYIVVSGLKIKNSNGAGIYAAYSDNIKIIGNKTYDTVKSGIGIWGSTNIVVEYNDIELACKDHPNYGSSEEPITIDSSSQVEVRYNKVHDGPTGQNPARAGGEGINVKENSHFVYIHHNEVWNISDKTGLSIDAWGGDLSNVYVYNNISRNNLIGITLSNERNIQPGVSNVFVYNNLIYDNTNYGIYFPNYMENGPISNIYVTNNTVYKNGYGFYGLSNNGTNKIIRNNIFSENTQTLYINSSGASGYILDHNLFYGAGSVSGTNNVIGNPLFINANARDLHLQNTSPAIDKGLLDNIVLNDYDNIPRPQGVAYDIGAYEYSSSLPVITNTPKPTSTNTTTPVTITTTKTSTPSRTLTATSTPSRTFTPTSTQSRTPTPTSSVTASKTSTATYTLTSTSTITPTPVKFLILKVYLDQNLTICENDTITIINFSYITVYLCIPK